MTDTGRRRSIVRAGLVMSLLGGLAGCDAKNPVAPNSPLLIEQPWLFASANLLVQDTVPRPLAGVRVEISAGEDAGKIVTTGADGRVTVAGRVSPSGALHVRISKDGLRTLEQQYVSSSSANIHRVTLTPDAFVNLAGEHVLTIDADPACEGLLPAVARSRTYRASITSSSSPSYFNIQLSGAAFFRNFSYFGVFVGADALRFEIYLPPWDEEPIAEQLSPDTCVVYSGDAEGDVRSGDPVITARLLGLVSYCAATPAGTSFICPVAPVNCAGAHRVTLTRQ